MELAMGLDTGALAPDKWACLGCSVQSKTSGVLHACDIQTSSLALATKRPLHYLCDLTNAYLVLICMPDFILSAFQVIARLRLCS